MSQIEMLRLLITQRLTAAAEEIFGVFGRTIAEYEDQISRSRLEIERQRRLLDLSRKPRVSLQADREALREQQEWSSGLSDMEAPPIKEEEKEEELWPAEHQEEEQSDVKFFQSGEPDDDERTACLQSELRDPDDPDPLPDPLPGPLPDPLPGPSALQSCPVPGEEASALVSGNGGPDCVALDALLSEALDSYICTVCGRAFAQRGHWAKHVQGHRRAEPRVDKSYTCDICGKRLTRFDGYQKHLRIHTGEKPYRCAECGRRFSDNSNYKRHIRTHLGQRTPLS